MELAAWAEQVARDLLGLPLPRRWAHTRGVAATARRLAPVLGRDADLIGAAAWLHDIGYAPRLRDTGFHPLDGARYLRDAARADPLLCRLVAHHSCAQLEADERGLGAGLAQEFRPAPQHLADALIYADMTTGPDGQHMDVRDRIAEIRSRYGPGHVVSRAIDRSAPELAAAVTRMQRELTRCAPARPAIRLPALAVAGQPM